MLAKPNQQDIVNKQIQIVPNRLYFYSTNKKYKKPNDSIFQFNVDDSLTYVPFHNDFGPLKISCVYQYINQLDLINKQYKNSQKQFWHITSSDPKKYTNSILLICAYSMIVLKKSPVQAYEPFQKYKIIGFRDSSLGNCSFQIQVLDCLKGLYKAVQLGWFSLEKFSVDDYEHYEKIQNGDMNEIVKDKIYSFSIPSEDQKDRFGKKQITPTELSKTFKSLNITSVIHLSPAETLSKALRNENITDYNLPFPEFTFPQSDLIQKFIQIIQKEGDDGRFAISCKTGLGKSGTMIGCYVIKRYRFTAVEYIAWVRLCRPGSVVGPQQEFLVDFDKKINKESRSWQPPKSLQKKKPAITRRNSQNTTSPQTQQQQQQPESPTNPNKLLRSQRIIRKSDSLKIDLNQIPETLTPKLKVKKKGFDIDQFLESVNKR